MYNSSNPNSIQTVIRPATKKDLDNLAMTISQIAKEDALVGLEPALLDVQKTVQVLKELLDNNNNVALLAEQGDNIVGTALAGSKPYETESLYMGLFVLKSFQKQGIGHLLLEQVIQRSTKRGVKRLLLNVLEHNRKAISLYTHFGFQQVDCKKAALFEKGRFLKEITMEKKLH